MASCHQRHLPKSFCHWPARTSPPIFARPWLHGYTVQVWEHWKAREIRKMWPHVASSLTNLDVCSNTMCWHSTYFQTIPCTTYQQHQHVWGCNMCIKHIKTSQSDASSDLAPLLHPSWWLDWVSSPPWPYLALPWLLQQRNMNLRDKPKRKVAVCAGVKENGPQLPACKSKE